MRDPAPPRSAMSDRRLILPSAIIGIGLSGFFDGILLHQVLQWHHLLSLVPGESFRDLRTQIFADGIFHVLMYLVTGAGLWLLWRRRAAWTARDADWRAVAGGGLLGFGVWNVIDVGFFHWILGIHRIRVNVDDPLLYDVAWMGLFGAVPLAMGWFLLRKSGSGGGVRGKAAALGLVLLAAVAAPLASLPQPGANTALVVLSPGAAVRVMNAASAADARLLWFDPERRLMVLALRDSAEPASVHAALYGAGAWMVTRSPVLAGCAVMART